MARVAVLVDVVPDEVLERADQIGWKIYAAENGTYEVRDHGQNVKVHTSISSVKNALTRRENVLREQAAAANAAKLDRARTVARKSIQQSDALRSARGEYLVQESLDMEWVRMLHPVPAVRMCVITPENAKAILDTCNLANYRNMRDRDAGRYARVMAAGGWQLTHQGIAFDTHGILQDGQHRLRACVDSGMPIVVMVFVGMAADNIRYVDEGKARTATDLLKHSGFGATTSLAPTVRLVMAYGTDNPSMTLRQGVSNNLVAAFVEEHPELAACARRGTGLATSIRGDGFGTLSSVALGSARYLMSQVCDDLEVIESFLHGIATGFAHKGKSGTPEQVRTLIAQSDPRSRVRAWMQSVGRGKLNRARVPSLTQLVLINVAWNHMVAGERPRRLAYDPDFPVYPMPQRVSPELIEALEQQ